MDFTANSPQFNGILLLCVYEQANAYVLSSFSDFEKWRSFCCSGVESTPGNLPRWDHRWKQTSFAVPPIPVTCRNSDSMRLAR
ncbi:hypothetical protein OIU85_026501 [Salix viminalis]|uniref:Uncharacterized protein n=1 Tax=Salix viminalis TaxID=40686 RepID=A0A9Q0YYN2_SALVM|nr:hypothetical protein OIU85_026501 [Salix viminalis]